MYFVCLLQLAYVLFVFSLTRVLNHSLTLTHRDKSLAIYTGKNIGLLSFVLALCFVGFWGTNNTRYHKSTKTKNLKC